jgi:hypothetical protein
MENGDYIGYKKTIGDLVSSGTNFAAAGAAAYAAANAARAAGTGGLDIQADIALAMAGVQFLGDLWNQWTSHPAADARDFIKNHKPLIANLDPYNRLVNVIASSKKINPKAVDVNAAEWILWYKLNYPEDYKTLTPDVKKYWNDYLYSLETSYNNPNNMNANLDRAMFTTAEINSNATATQKVTNLFSTSTGKTNWVLYGAIGIGVILLIKYIKK